MTTYIHVNRQLMALNAKDEISRPVFIVRSGSGSATSRYAREVIVNGKTRFVSPGTQLKCGARAWAETDDDVTLIDETVFAEAKSPADPKIYARLYFEMHITVDADADFGQFAADCANTLPNWRVSMFDQDDVDHYHGKWFMSARFDEYNGAKKMMKYALDILVSLGYNVIRYKIEDTLLDSKHGDTLEN